ncbi:MAG: YibE/F family protein [Anaerolineae bacterium]
MRFASSRVWWIAGGLVAILIFVLLAAIAGRGAQDLQGDMLAPGETESLHAKVIDVLEQGTIDQGEFQQPYQVLYLRITEGPLQGQEIQIEYGTMRPTSDDRLFRVGDRVIVDRTRTVEGEDFFSISDYVRGKALLWLTLLFIASTVLLSGWQGVRSLIGMAISLAVIVGFIVPQILNGADPVFIAIVGSVVMMGASLYLVYGWRSKTHVAVAGLLLSLMCTGVLAVWFVSWARLSGFGAEEASFLQVAGVQLDLQGLLLAGIIIGVLGALDDIAIGQSSAVFELSKANPNLSRQKLFRHGMTIGRDHIAAMVNTLLLAYVGAALPLVLLFTVYAEPIGITLNREIIAEEIVRTLVGSLGLLAGVPLTSLIASLVARPGKGKSAPGER